MGRGRSGAGADEFESQVRVELAHVQALADLALVLGPVMPAGQDYDNRWQWAVNAWPEAGRMKVVAV